MKNIKIIKGEFKEIGINEIDVDLVVSKWNHLWVLSEWRVDNSWRLIKFIRKDSQITEMKLTICDKQANDIINKLELKPINTGFKNGYTWRVE